MQKRVSVYVLECEDDAWYVGMAEDPHARFEQHKALKGAIFTRLYPPKRMAHLFWCDSKEEAEHLEDAMTYVLQGMFMKVAGGRWTRPSPAGRGREWTEEELAFRGLIHKYFGWTKKPKLRRDTKKKQRSPKQASAGRKPVKVPIHSLVSDIREMGKSVTLATGWTSDMGLDLTRKRKPCQLSSKEIVEQWKRRQEHKLV